jgi:hypothetical protein
MHGQKNDLDGGIKGTELPGGVNAIQQRHGYVGDDDVWKELSSGLQQSAAIANGAGDLEVWLIEYKAKPGDDDIVVVG